MPTGGRGSRRWRWPDSAGRGLGELSYASVDTFENVRPMVMAGAMMKMSVALGLRRPTEEFTPQSVSVTAHVNALVCVEVGTV